jgi:6,7-dimethyl-8-ribityllumazine synthase
MAKRRRSAPKTASKTASTKARPAKQQKTPRILIVEARYYAHIADALLKGATDALNEAAAEFDVVTVPGALEIVPAIAMAVEAGNYDGVVALGCVIQGETFHFDIVAMQSARALIDLAVALRLPAGNGILTVDNEAQALARATTDQRNKGREAAKAALALVSLKRDLAGKR